MKSLKDYSKLNKILTAAILVVSVTACFAFVSISFAAYTHSTRAQRTIAAYDTAGVQFSSNILKATADLSDAEKWTYSTAEGYPAVDYVMICNYEQGKSTPYPTDIEYSLKATLIKGNKSTIEDESYITGLEGDTKSYTVTITDGTTKTSVTLGNANLDHTFSGKKLTGGVTNAHIFTVSFSADWASYRPDMYLKLVAHANAEGFSDLIGMLKPNIRAQEARTSWTGEFKDNSSYAPSAYDGYNYAISGTGAGTFTLKWDNTKLALSDVSFAAINADLTERSLSTITISTMGAPYTNVSYITFDVDSEAKNIYEIVFYKTATIDLNDWGDMQANSSLASSSSDLGGKLVGWYFAI